MHRLRHLLTFPTNQIYLINRQLITSCNCLSSATGKFYGDLRKQQNKGKASLKPSKSATYFESKWLDNQDPESEIAKARPKKHQHEDSEQRDNSFKDERNPNERLQKDFAPENEHDRDFRLGIPLTRHGRTGKTAFSYTKKMSKLAKEGKIQEAIAVYDDLMMKRDRVLPRKRTFITLIGILGRVGYTRKAFQLFRQMRMLGFDVDDHIYTSLFNACANSPSQEDGLVRTEKLIRHLQENEVKPNLFTVKSCMKALAVCGDFSRAFAVLDEAATRMQLDSECFNALLIACVADKEAGFLRSLLVWRKMKEMQIQPQANTFNLLLRCVRDCGIGDPKTFHHLLGVTGSQELTLSLESGLPISTPRLPTAHDAVSGQITSGFKAQTQKIQSGTSLNEVRSSNAQIQHGKRVNSVSGVSEMSDAQRLDRDYERVIFAEADFRSAKEAMAKERMVEAMRDNSLNRVKHREGRENSEWWASELTSEGASEEEGLGVPKSLSVLSTRHTKGGDRKHRTDLVSVRSKERSPLQIESLTKPESRLALLGGASNFLSHMAESGATPDVKTFSQLLACVPNDEGSETALLDYLKETGLKPDTDFLNDIMARRHRRKDYKAVKMVLKSMSEFRLTPNMRTYAALALSCNTRDKAEQLLEDMENAGLEPSVEVMSHLLMASFTNFAYKLAMLKTLERLGHKPTTRILTNIEKSIASAKGKIAAAERRNDTDSFYLSDAYTVPLRNFLNYYRQWLQRTEVNRPEHPWKAFEASNQLEEEDDPKLSVEKKL